VQIEAAGRDRDADMMKDIQALLSFCAKLIYLAQNRYEKSQEFFFGFCERTTKLDNTTNQSNKDEG